MYIIKIMYIINITIKNIIKKIIITIRIMYIINITIRNII